jgi:hypothetical protein
MRRIGVADDMAGTQVFEKSTAGRIVPAALGNCLMAGIVERGATDELNICGRQQDFDRYCGERWDGNVIPDQAKDFFDNNRGAGTLYQLRITDGAEVLPSYTLYASSNGRYLLSGPVVDPTWDEQKVPILTLAAKNGGRWAGRLRCIDGLMPTSVAASLTNTTLTTGITMLVNEYAGATLSLDGVTTLTYTVLSNTTAGVVTVQASSQMLTDMGASVDRNYRLFLPNTTTQLGDRKGLQMLWKDSSQDPTTMFGLEVWLDGTKILDESDLSMDPNNANYVVNKINRNTSNKEVVATAVYASGGYDNTKFPFDLQSDVMALSGSQFTVPILFETSRVTGGGPVGNGIVTDVTIPANARVRRHQLTLTFNGGGTFDVAIASPSYLTIEVIGAVTPGTPYVASSPYTVGFTVRTGTVAFNVGDVITLDVIPLPTDLATGDGLLVNTKFYPDRVTNPNTSHYVSANTADTVTVVGTPAAGTAATRGEIASSADITFPFVVTTGVNDAITASTDIDVTPIAIVLAQDLVGYASAELLAIEINGKWVAGGGTGAIAVGTTLTATTGRITIGSVTSYAAGTVGYDNWVDIDVVANSIYATTFLVAGTYRGIPGTTWFAQGRLEFAGGYDGDTPANADYIAAANVNTSLVRNLLKMNTGLVKLATPGVTAAAVQTAWITLAEAANQPYRAEFTAATTTEQGAVAFLLDSLGRSDFLQIAFPSYGYSLDPRGGSTLVERSRTGKIFGMEARTAAEFGGYHKAAAGVEAVLEGDKGDRLEGADLDEGLLNRYGIQPIKPYNAGYIVWGDRLPFEHQEWTWKHQREQMSYYENVLAVAYNWLIFAINDKETQDFVYPTLADFFYKRWKNRELRGDKFSDACVIKIDSENNTDATRAAGELNAEIELNLADTVEKFRITVSKRGIFEGAA